MFRVSLFSLSPILQNVTGSSASYIRTTSHVAALSKSSIFFHVGAKRFDTCRFYSTEYSTGRSHLGSASFPKIALSPNFVDKTLFIEAFLECGSDYLLITAPRRFGKSINLDMLRCFFHDRTYETLFRNLRIGNTTTMKNLGTLPVLWLNFKNPGCITSYEEAVMVCRDIIHDAFREHRYLITSSKLDVESKDYCKVWCDSIRYESLSVSQVTKGLVRLAECLYIHNGRKSLLLIDEYDAICTAAFANVDAKTLDHIIELYGGIVGSVVKQNAKFVERAVITGILRVMCTGLSSPVNNVVDYPFSEEGKFADFYGITEKEFDELLSRKCNASIVPLKESALRFYNGYEWDKKRILNTWSVMNLLEKKLVKPYWVESGLPVLRIHESCKHDVVRKTVKEVVEGNTISVRGEVFNARSLLSFLDEFRDNRAEIVRVDLLLYYYAQQGYLTITECVNDSIKLKIPNEEVRNMFVNGLASYFVDIYRIYRAMIDTCANLFRSINLSDENECKNTIERIGRALQAMCNRGDYSRSELMNEALLEDLMFVLMYLSGFQPVTQTIVRQTDGSFTKLDLCVYRNTSRGAVIEFKINKTAKVALDTIFEKGYARELYRKWNLSYLRQLVSFFSGKKSERSRDLTEDTLREYLPEKYNFLLIGINLEKNSGKCGKHVLSIRYLRNSFSEEDEIQIVFN